MIIRIKQVFLAIITFLTVFTLNCQQVSTPKTVQLSIHGLKENSSNIKLLTYDMLNYIEIPLKLIDSSFHEAKELEFAIQGPMFGSIKVDESYHPVYIEAGDKLNISINSEVVPPTITYSGKGSLANNYLAGIERLVNNFYQTNGEFWRSDSHLAEKALETLQRQIEKFHNDYADTSSLNIEIQELFRKRNELILIDLIQQFAVINQIPYANRDSVPDIFKQISSNIPMNADYLKLKMIEYARVLDLYLRVEIHPAFLKGKEATEIEALKESFPAESNKLIKAKKLPSGIQEFLQAKDIDHWLALQGLSSSIDSLYQEFLKAYTGSSYKNKLEKHYKDWLRITPAKPAVNITGLTLQGDTLSLNDLRGNLIYIDVWASWCLPCIDEFSHYEDLQNEFSDNQRVKFLFVSIDKEVNEWTNFLQTKPHPEGIHINDLKEDNSYKGIYKSYKMWGIPRYIIIDEAGIIVDANALPPSSDKLKKQLKDLTS